MTKLPSAGVRYIEHLVTHETMHQWFWNVIGTDGYAETFMDEGIVNGLTVEAARRQIRPERPVDRLGPPA